MLDAILTIGSHNAPACHHPSDTVILRRKLWCLIGGEKFIGARCSHCWINQQWHTSLQRGLTSRSAKPGLSFMRVVLR
jgi:hypothetical protein